MMPTKVLIDAVARNPKPEQTELKSTPQPSAHGYYGGLSQVILQLTIPDTAKNGIVLQAQGSIDGKNFGNLVHRRLDDGTVNTAPTYLPSKNPYLLSME